MSIREIRGELSLLLTGINQVLLEKRKICRASNQKALVEYEQPESFTIESACAAQKGNYLVFFPPYAYMAAVVELIRERFPERLLLIQDKGMKEEERETFLTKFRHFALKIKNQRKC